MTDTRDTITLESLAELEALAKATTPDWYVYKDEYGRSIAIARRAITRGIDVAHRPSKMSLGEWDTVANFIVALRNAFPSLAATIRAMMAANTSCKALAQQQVDIANNAVEQVNTLRSDLAKAQARIAELEEGLRPFVEWSAPDVKLADELQPDLMSYDDDCEVEVGEFDNPGFAFTWGDLRRAARLLQPEAKKEGEG